MSSFAHAQERLVGPDLDSRREVEVAFGIDDKRLRAGDCADELGDRPHSDAFAMLGLAASSGADWVVYCESDKAEVGTCWCGRYT